MLEIDVRKSPLKEINELCVIADAELDVENEIVKIPFEARLNEN